MNRYSFSLALSFGEQGSFYAVMYYKYGKYYFYYIELNSSYRADLLGGCLTFDLVSIVNNQILNPS